MDKQPTKTIIGLTGNIAAGKSSIRRMLQHLGAFGIDADGLSHLAMAPGAPAYTPIVRLFGQYILNSDQSINRTRLGRIVFGDTDALHALEQILHPVVRQAIELLIARAPQAVIVIEAIKLLESPLKARCNSIWVVDAPAAVREKRLVQHRQMSAADAQQRVAAQSAAASKIAQADVVIQNAGHLEQTWEQVQRAWQRTVPNATPSDTPPAATPAITPNTMQLVRLRPNDAAEIAAFSRANPQPGSKQHPTPIQAFGDKAYLGVRQNGKLIGLLGWQVENLVARIDELYAVASEPAAPIYQLLLQSAETAAKALQAEVALVALPAAQIESHPQPFREAGYLATTLPDVKIAAWQEAAREILAPNARLLFKKLREQRVMRPI